MYDVHYFRCIIMDDLALEKG